MNHLPHPLQDILKKYLMRISLALIILLFTSSILIAPLHAQEGNRMLLGTKHTMYSDTLNENREYWISLPESYHTEKTTHKTYPLLLLLDGQAHFRAISGMVHYMSTGYNGNREIPEMIVVGIQNVNRQRDFTPDKVITRRPNDSGGGEQFIHFLEKELIPILDSTYRTVPYRILYGHSLGGLLATHTYMKERTLFNAFIAIDPSMGTWDAQTMDDKLEKVTPQSFNRFIYIASANWKKRNLRNRDRHLRLFDALNSKCPGTLPASISYFENEDHGSVPIIAFHDGMSAIFAGYGVSYREIERKEDLLAHFQVISDRLSYPFLPPEALANRIGYRLLNHSSSDIRKEALDIFRLNCQFYPNSYNAFDSLGNAYETLGETEKAISNYTRSIQLNPKNVHAMQRLQALTKNE